MVLITVAFYQDRNYSVIFVLQIWKLMWPQPGEFKSYIVHAADDSKISCKPTGDVATVFAERLSTET
jgi:hypothetical protein